jgi:hypothetical protein
MLEVPSGLLHDPHWASLESQSKRGSLRRSSFFFHTCAYKQAWRSGMKKERLQLPLKPFAFIEVPSGFEPL